MLNIELYRPSDMYDGETHAGPPPTAGRRWGFLPAGETLGGTSLQKAGLLLLYCSESFVNQLNLSDNQ